MRRHCEAVKLLAGLAILVLVAGCGGSASPTVTATARPAAIATPIPTATLFPTAGSAIPSTPRPIGPIGAGRQIQTATLLADGRVLVAGGYDVNDAALASAARYDPRTNAFSQTGSMRSARGYHTATLLADGHVLIAGGGPASWVEGKEGPFLASAELYDPKTGTFSPTGSMATPRSFHTATLLSDGRVLIAGGSPGMWTFDAALASAEIYDPKTGRFSPTGPMGTGRAWQAATLLTDGRVLITGGQTNHTELASAELFDPKTGAFIATGSMTVGRVYHTATLLADGRVLVAGGGGDYAEFKFLASAELYDPKSGTFIATASMSEARTYHAATRLQDGRVLLAGGYGAGAPLASAELYDPKTGTFNPAG